MQCGDSLGKGKTWPWLKRYAHREEGKSCGDRITLDVSGTGIGGKPEQLHIRKMTCLSPGEISTVSSPP